MPEIIGGKRQGWDWSPGSYCTVLYMLPDLLAYEIRYANCLADVCTSRQCSENADGGVVGLGTKSLRIEAELGKGDGG